MHSQAAVAKVLALRLEGLGARRIAARTGLPLGTVRDWLGGRVPKHSQNVMPGEPVEPVCVACGRTRHRFAELPPEYVYLLGLYLGDGCISAHRKGVFRLRVFLDLRYPLIIEDCVAAMRTVMPESKVLRQERYTTFNRLVPADTPSNVEVSSFSKAWPCFLPQHGPGKKHDRPIALAPWQSKLVERWPEQLVRGLIHSDGCRFQNTGRGNWSWPRYAFDNKSDDIRAVFCRACELTGVHWTFSRPHTVYVSRKADVAVLDEFIGPKA